MQWVLWILAVLFVVVAPAMAEPYQQDPLPDGITVIEAEGYHAIDAPGTHSWQPNLSGVYSGGEALQALPNTNINQNSGFIGVSPRLDYDIHFQHAGTNYIIVRGYGPSSQDDSVHAGLNGVTATSDRIGSFNGSVQWEGDTFDGNQAYVIVPSPGVHTVSFWMREDGFNFDKFLITTNPDFFPGGLGPPLSPEGTNPPPEEAALPLQLTNVRYTNGLLMADITPHPSIEAYVPLGASDVDGLMTNDGQAATVGYTLVVDPDLSTNQYFQVKAMPVASERRQSAAILNRLAYGPTLQDLDDILITHAPTGSAWWIDRQLAPETIPDPLSTTRSNASVNVQAADASLSDLRAWYLLDAVESERQLLEVMLQFFNNHFITYFWKNRSWFRNEYGLSNSEAESLAVKLDLQELTRWRQALLDPNTTFYDLLEISAESPAMIIFLDTVTNDKDAPNENYARELQELFTMGVDNGYTQDDIEEMARVWTGWRVASFNPADAGNPHAVPTTNALELVGLNTTWSYRLGTNEPAAHWNTLAYVEDATWQAGQGPFGFGDGDDNTVLTNMQSNFSTVYARQTFNVLDPSSLGNLQLGMWFDDGFVAYLNGNEVARHNVSGSPAYNSTASGGHEANDLEFYSLGAASNVLVAGVNVLALHGLNTSFGSSDFSLDGELKEELIWQMAFDAMAHDTSNKILYVDGTVDPRFGDLGGNVPYELVVTGRVGTAGIDEGYEVLAHLADLPYTQEYIVVKLCQLLVHEDFRLGSYFNISQSTPESELIRAAMEAWQDTASSPDGRQGNVRQVVRAIIESDLFMSQAALAQKVKTPMELVVSALRALQSDAGTSSTDGYDLITPMDRMGMGLFTRFEPDGFPEFGSEWIDTSTISERMRFIQNYLMDPADSLKEVDYGSWNIHNVADPVALLQAELSAPELTDGQAVTLFFLDLLYPGEGTANLDVDMAICLSLLNSDATGAPDSSPFSSLSPGSSAYDQRVRSLVGLLMTSPRFNEQ